MDAIGLATYSIRVQPSTGIDNLRFDNFGHGYDLLDLVQSERAQRLAARQLAQGLAEGQHLPAGWAAVDSCLACQLGPEAKWGCPLPPGRFEGGRYGT